MFTFCYHALFSFRFILTIFYDMLTHAKPHAMAYQFDDKILFYCVMLCDPLQELLLAVLFVNIFFSSFYFLVFRATSLTLWTLCHSFNMHPFNLLLSHSFIHTEYSSNIYLTHPCESPTDRKYGCEILNGAVEWTHVASMSSQMHKIRCRKKFDDVTTSVWIIQFSAKIPYELRLQRLKFVIKLNVFST